MSAQDFVIDQFARAAIEAGKVLDMDAHQLLACVVVQVGEIEKRTENKGVLDYDKTLG
jgi:hypothetical protein